MLAFRNEYLRVREGESLTILDLGSCDVNGSYKSLFNSPSWTYIGVDMSPGKNVDIVLSDPYNWREIESSAVDVLISGQTFEHIEFFWMTMLELARILKPGGLCCIIAPSNGVEHKYPVDCWRFYSDGFSALARYAHLEVLKVFTQWENLGYKDGSDIWKDSVLVCRKPYLSDSVTSMSTIDQSPQADVPDKEGLVKQSNATSSIQTGSPTSPYIHRAEILKKYRYELSLDSDTRDAKLIAFVGTGKNVLEVGCASGVQSKVFKDVLGCSVTGIEINEEAAKEARQYCKEVIVGDIEQIDFEELLKDRKFDIVIFSDVLEHLKNPSRALEKVNPLLADDGYVVASIPNIAHSAVVYQLMKGHFDYRDYGLLDDTHIRFFTKKTIYQTFERAGFAVCNLDRVICRPDETEFNVTAETEEDRTVLNYIAANNPESNTYQFIVKAYKADASERAFRLAAERIQELEDAVTRREAEIKKIDSALKWITNKRLYKLYSRVSTLFGRRT
jgi:2-polyprenyl-3-methyl-5-hydroxy-6-metoxy-1,4-benzoquinol methylase